jgi:hypothetical protein
VCSAWFRYERQAQPLPKIGPWRDKLDQLLLANEGKAARERLTLIRPFEKMRGLDCDGVYDAVRRYARQWSKERGASTAAAFGVGRFRNYAVNSDQFSPRATNPPINTAPSSASCASATWSPLEKGIFRPTQSHHSIRNPRGDFHLRLGMGVGSLVLEISARHKSNRALITTAVIGPLELPGWALT